MPTEHQIRLTAAAIDRALAALPTRQAQPSRPTPCLGGEIARYRRRRGLSQVGLARAVGCDRSFVCRWERGERTPSLAHLAALARVFGADPGPLLALAARERGQP